MDKEESILLVRRIADSAKRLETFIDAGIPLLIEKERRGLFKKLMKFPIDPDGAKAADEADKIIREDEMKFLTDHGYFDDIDLGKQP